MKYYLVVHHKQTALRLHQQHTLSYALRRFSMQRRYIRREFLTVLESRLDGLFCECSTSYDHLPTPADREPPQL